MVSKQSIVRRAQFVRLEPYQVSTHWPLLRSALEEAFSSSPPSSFMNYLANLQSGEMQAWAVLSVREKNPVLVGLAFTQVLRDQATGTTKLYVMAAKGYNFLADSVYAEGVRVFEQFARDNRCQMIEAITELPRIGKMLARSGWAKSELYRKEIS